MATAEQEWSLSVLVVNVKEDGILGMDFLGEAVIDCKAKFLTLHGKRVPLVGKTARNSEKDCYKIYLDETVQLPAQSGVVVTGRVGCEEDTAGLALVVSCSGRDGLLVEDALVDLTEGKTLPLRLLNMSDFPMKLRKGMNVAQCEAVTEATCDIKVLKAKRKTCSTKMPDHLKILFEDSTEFLTREETEEVRKILLEFQHVFSSGPDDLGR